MHIKDIPFKPMGFSETVRWSLDVRYQPAGTPLCTGQVGIGSARRAGE
jgi:hypothetical protein